MKGADTSSGGLRLCGLAAVKARFQHDPDSIQRLFFDAPTARRIGMMCRVLAASRRVYRCVESAELERIAGTVHHGGIVAVVSESRAEPLAPSELAGWVRKGECLVALEKIGNPHNLGAIARTAAFFGVPRLVITGEAGAARPGDAAYRVAEGGLEFLEVRVAADLPALLREMVREGFDVVGAATRGGAPGATGGGGGASARAAARGAARGAGAGGGGARAGEPGPGSGPGLSAGKGGAGSPGAGGARAPWALVLGNEEEGLSAAAVAACGRLVTIPGSGRVESLNVSAAAAVLIHDLVRARSAARR